MTENKNYYIDARFTTSEKKGIKQFAKNNGQSLSELLRESLFSHINFLKQFKGKTKKIEVYIVEN